MSIYNWYQDQVLSGKLKNNSYQIKLIKAYDEFLIANAKSKFLSLFNKKPLFFGFYIYGSFGCGKTMLLNSFFSMLPSLKKLRVHFHEFINQMNNSIATNKITIEKYCSQLKKKFDYIFLDEFHVSDIATAMLLYKILVNMFNQNIIIITTSNFQPDELYKDGLMRDRFIPAINLIKDKLQLHYLKITQDYRRENNQLTDNFIYKNSKAGQLLTIKFEQYAIGSILNNGFILIQQREINFIKKANNIIWFEFNIICGDLRSQIDYIQLAQLYDFFIIDNIVKLEASDKDIARRFTWLIDILYDSAKKIIISTSIDIDSIYLDGLFNNEFKRTISRLHEMQTVNYLTIPVKNILWET
jgi:cell division protein ZapE